MQVARFILSILLVLVLSQRLNAQQSVTTQQRDSQAVAMLQKCIAAGGGAQAFETIQDFVALGTITYYWAGQDVVGSVTVRGKGLTEFRLDSVLPQGTRTFKVLGRAGSIATEDGKTRALRQNNLMTAASLTFPGVRIANVLNDSTVVLQYMGLVTFESAQAYQIRVIPPVGSSFAPPSGAAQFGSFDLYVDPSSYQLLELSEWTWPAQNNQAVRHEIRYSNYQSAGSVAAPYGISEYVNGQQTWSISLSSISFNNSLSDSIFKS
jgi:hypothetical protein